MSYFVLTIGHSVRPLFEFIEKLQENKIEVLVDVRSHPQSRFCPQYNQKALSEELAKVGITYLFKGRNLGGKEENIDYEQTVDELVAMVKEGRVICVACSEADYKKCHRHEMLEPSFVQRGLSVRHISYD